MKKFILNADDLAKTEFNNSAVFNGAEYGLLKSASLMVNNDNYIEAINFFKDKKDFRLGIHLNIIEGKSLNNGLKTLCDKDNNFNNGFLGLLLKSNSKRFLDEVECEFRSQIETMMKYSKISHIDSHVHTHSIPNIFKITKKLALEYGINYIRTQSEIPYYIKGTMSKGYLINQIKVILLNYFTLINKRSLKNTSISTNDYILGVSYTGMMDSATIFEGLKKFAKKDNILVEALIHPEKYDDSRINSHTKEFNLTLDEDLKRKIKELGFSL